MKHARLILILAAVLGALTVALGAFGAHGLEKTLNELPRGREYWGTATQYALVHAAALVGLAGYAARENGSKVVRGAAWCWFGGAVVFAGALMTIALGGPKWFGAIAPIGGTALILGWVLAGVAAFPRREGSKNTMTRDNSIKGPRTDEARRGQDRRGQDRRNDRRRR